MDLLQGKNIFVIFKFKFYFSSFGQYRVWFWKFFESILEKTVKTLTTVPLNSLCSKKQTSANLKYKKFTFLHKIPENSSH